MARGEREDINMTAPLMSMLYIRDNGTATKRGDEPLTQPWLDLTRAMGYWPCAYAERIVGMVTT